MKRLCEDDQQSGLEALIGESVLLLCGNYFYHGTVEALSDTEIELSNAGIVYEVGPWDDEGFADIQKLPGNVFVHLQAVEAHVPM